jgi:hypothetical protein
MNGLVATDQRHRRFSGLMSTGGVLDPARIVGTYRLIQARKAGGGQQEFLADVGTFSIIAILIGL